MRPVRLSRLQTHLEVAIATYQHLTSAFSFHLNITFILSTRSHALQGHHSFVPHAYDSAVRLPVPLPDAQCVCRTGQTQPIVLMSATPERPKLTSPWRRTARWALFARKRPPAGARAGSNMFATRVRQISHLR